MVDRLYPGHLHQAGEKYHHAMEKMTNVPYWQQANETDKGDRKLPYQGSITCLPVELSSPDGIRRNFRWPLWSRLMDKGQGICRVRADGNIHQRKWARWSARKHLLRSGYCTLKSQKGSLNWALIWHLRIQDFHRENNPMIQYSFWRIRLEASVLIMNGKLNLPWRWSLLTHAC